MHCVSLEMTASASTKKLTHLQLRIRDFVRRGHGVMARFAHFLPLPSSHPISYLPFSNPPLLFPTCPSSPLFPALPSPPQREAASESNYRVYGRTVSFSGMVRSGDPAYHKAISVMFSPCRKRLGQVRLLEFNVA